MVEAGVSDFQKYQAVRAYVIRERKRRRIKNLGAERKPELSCEMFGEYFNLVERQLLYTKEGYGAWIELSDPEILDCVYQYILGRQNRRIE